MALIEFKGMVAALTAIATQLKRLADQAQPPEKPIVHARVIQTSRDQIALRDGLEAHYLAAGMTRASARAKVRDLQHRARATP